MQHPAFASTRAVLAAAALALAGGCSKPPRNENVRPIDHGQGGRNADPDQPGSGPMLDGGGRPPASDGGARDGGAAGSDDEGPVIGGGSGTGGSGGSTAADAAVVDPPPFSKRALLEAAGQCALAHYRDFELHARALAEATEAYADDVDEEHAAAARTAWLTAMASFERVELFRFGPLARNTDPGGENLRDEIYVFPLANDCRVDQQIVNRVYAEPGFASSLSNARGLTALEYLLFRGSSGNACGASIDINDNGSWAALSESELAQRRADYAAAAAADVLARATALVERWEPSGGDFYAQLTRAGAGSDAYAMDQDALNAVSDAIFYVENEVKDVKLGLPLGRVPECENSPEPCPGAVESRHARVSTDHLRQNLAAFRKLFQGCGPSHSGHGFDDWLYKVSAGDLAERMLDALAGAQAAVDGLDPPLEQALTSDIARVGEVHAAVKMLTDLMKAEFTTVLNLELPEGAVGDND